MSKLDEIARRNDENALAFIHAFFMGERSRELPARVWEHVYATADGFGKLSREELREINDGFDWSHIRDSSWQALADMERILMEWCIDNGRPFRI